MKKGIIIFMLNIFLIQQIFSQDAPKEEAFSSIPIIIPQEGFFSRYEYKDENGSGLKRIDIWDRIEGIPGNENIITPGKISSVVRVSTSILTLASMALYGGLTIVDYENSVIMDSAIPIAFSASFLTCILSGQFEKRLMEKGVHNYNLYNLK